MFFSLQKIISDFAVEITWLVFLFMLVGFLRGLGSQRWGTFINTFVFGIVCFLFGNYERIQAISISIWNLIKANGMS